MNLGKLLKQTISYWSTPVSDGYGGWTFTAPIALVGRWEDIVQVMQTSAGEEFISKSRIYLTIDPDLDGYLFLGTSVGANPAAVADALPVRKIMSIPSINTDQTLYEVWL